MQGWGLTAGVLDLQRQAVQRRPRRWRPLRLSGLRRHTKPCRELRLGSLLIHASMHGGWAAQSRQCEMCVRDSQRLSIHWAHGRPAARCPDHLQDVVACEVRPAGVPVRLPDARRLCSWHRRQLQPRVRSYLRVKRCFWPLGRHFRHCTTPSAIRPRVSSGQGATRVSDCGAGRRALSRLCWAAQTMPPAHLLPQVTNLRQNGLRGGCAERWLHCVASAADRAPRFGQRRGRVLLMQIT